MIKPRYKYIALKEVKKNVPEMKRLKVSIKARSKGQFLDQFSKANGNYRKMPEYWQRKRDNFVARHLSQYKKDKGYRRKLALIAWAYKP